MTPAEQIPTSIGTTGNYVFRPSQSASRSEGAYRASSADFMTSFYAVLHRWERETAFVSDPDEITAHPSFAALVANAELMLPQIVEELRVKPSLLVWVLDDALGTRPYNDRDIGNIEAMTNAWIAWAERNGRTL
jgi:hypothetical protein